MWLQMHVSVMHCVVSEQQRCILDQVVHHNNCDLVLSIAVGMTSFLQASRAVDLARLPDQAGKIYLITGGNTGLGYEMVKALAAKNAHVFMTSRNSEKQKRYYLASITRLIMHACRGPLSR